MSTVSLDYEASPSIPLDISVVDKSGIPVVKSVLINVTDANDSPEWQSALSSASGAGYSLPADIVTDQHGDELTFTITLSNGAPLPAWLNFNEEDLSFNVIDAVPAESEITVSVNVTDERGAQTTAPLTLRFDPALAAATSTDGTENVTSLRFTVPSKINWLNRLSNPPQR